MDYKSRTAVLMQRYLTPNHDLQSLSVTHTLISFRSVFQAKQKTSQHRCLENYP